MTRAELDEALKADNLIAVDRDDLLAIVRMLHDDDGDDLQAFCRCGWAYNHPELLRGGGLRSQRARHVERMVAMAADDGRLVEHR